ncbi:MAG: alpha/beta hydrolase [Leptothrix sp. (in: b-proteobacteria)]
MPPGTFLSRISGLDIKPKKIMRKFIRAIAWSVFSYSTLACADNSTVSVEVRPDVNLTIHYMRHGADQAKGVVALIPGGGGGLNLSTEGEPQNQNFLIRSRQLFYDAGYDVVSIGNPSDMVSLAPRYRSSKQHVGDLEAVIKFVKAQTNLPVWLVGTSRGTTSAAAAAVKFGNQLLAGLVLSSSVSTGKNGGAVQNEDLGDIKIPVLIVHHQSDGCSSTPTAGAQSILSDLKHAPIKKLILKTGGTATGSDCGPFHYHGYEGIEAETVADITRWVSKPTAE